MLANNERQMSHIRLLRTDRYERGGQWYCYYRRSMQRDTVADAGARKGMLEFNRDRYARKKNFLPLKMCVNLNININLNIHFYRY